MLALWDQGFLQSPRLSRSIGLREVRGVGRDLETLPARVGPWPTLLLQLNSGFSAPLVPVRDSEWQEWKISGLWGCHSDGFGQRDGQSSDRDQRSSRVPAPQIPPSCLHHFFLEPSHKIFSGLWVFLSVPVHLSRETSML